MKISEIVTFIKAGYSPAEITAIESPSDVLAILSEGVKKDDVPAFLELLAETKKETQDVEEVKEEPEKEADMTNYKVLYENLLKETQKQNTRENMADDMPNVDEILGEIARTFM